MTAGPTTDTFPTETAGLPAGVDPELVEVSDGDVFELRIAPVTKRLGDATVRMLAYNGSIPGPTLRVRQGSEVIVNVVNEGDLEATVHWHGVRVENRYDGTHETQAPMQVGESFTYRVQFPDPGVYWYHPHIREDYGQELGLYGNIVVVPTDPEYWPSANRELTLTLDDVLLEDGKIASFSRAETTHVAMGRFGNTLLVAGEPNLSLSAQLGEVVRLYLTNTANTRVFNVTLPGARMKLVGGDSGRCEQEQFVDEVLLAPSERVVVDVLFEEPGQLMLEHHTPERTYPLAEITVSGDRVVPSLGQLYEVLRSNADLAAERERIAPYLDAEPDKTLAFVAEMDMGRPAGAVVYACPMHPEVVSVRHEIGGHSRDDLHLPDAPGNRERTARPMPEMRHETAAVPARRRSDRSRSARTGASRRRQRPRTSRQRSGPRAARRRSWPRAARRGSRPRTARRRSRPRAQGRR
ncbi:MAG: hypothetical protein E6G08_21450 [Actinobacteria bacterium]|nr:MAG: hypothetical protein E6G08_21450 [Actinomycetota bacterium]